MMTTEQGKALYIEFFSLETWSHCFKSFTIMYNNRPRTAEETISELTRFVQAFGQSGGDLRGDLALIESKLQDGHRYGQNGFYLASEETRCDYCEKEKAEQLTEVAVFDDLDSEHYASPWSYRHAGFQPDTIRVCDACIEEMKQRGLYSE